MATKKEGPKTHYQGRNARDGQFTSVEKARRNPDTHVVERVPNPGYGDTKPPRK